MRLLEYQGKAILAGYGLSVPHGKVIRTNAEALEVVSDLGSRAALKAQVPVGGRGKVGGIRLCDSISSARDAVYSMLGSRIKGFPVTEVLVEERLDIQTECYLAVITDSSAGCPLVMVSAQGGIDIEDVARRDPDAVAQLEADPLYGFADYQARILIRRSGLSKPHSQQLLHWLKTLYRAYWETDALLVEVNPLAVTCDGRLLAADAHIVIDDNALFRQPKMQVWRTISADEARAEAAHINYLSLDGTIGIIGTGAGMAMANMDQVAFFGGQAANFMDVGPGVNTHGGRVAIDILLDRADLNAILISGYSGARLEVLAQDIVATLAARPKVRIPIVVRLQGTNDQEAIAILRQCPYPNLHLTEGFDEAARLAVELGKRQNDRF